MEKNLKEYTEAQLLVKLANFCAYQERSVFETHQKLKALGTSPEISKNIIARLETDNYLNDTRFAHAFGRGKHRFKQWGKNKIVQELQFKHRIALTVIDAVLAELEEENEYQNTLEALTKTKWEKLANSTDQFEKTCNYLLQKGYDLSEIIAVITKIKSV